MTQHSSPTKDQARDISKHLKTTVPSEQRARARALVTLIPLWTEELNDTSNAGRLKILSKLRRALRVERQHGARGHWSYDLARHKAMLDAYRREANFVRTQSPSCKLLSIYGIQNDG